MFFFIAHWIALPNDFFMENCPNGAKGVATVMSIARWNRKTVLLLASWERQMNSFYREVDWRELLMHENAKRLRGRSTLRREFSVRRVTMEANSEFNNRTRCGQKPQTSHRETESKQFRKFRRGKTADAHAQLRIIKVRLSRSQLMRTQCWVALSFTLIFTHVTEKLYWHCEFTSLKFEFTVVDKCQEEKKKSWKQKPEIIQITRSQCEFYAIRTNDGEIPLILVIRNVLY